jgi:hypothetical protein
MGMMSCSPRVGPRKTAFLLHFSWTDFRFMLL